MAKLKIKVGPDNKLMIVKLIKIAYNIGLKEAKDYVDAAQDQFVIIDQEINGGTEIYKLAEELRKLGVVVNIISNSSDLFVRIQDSIDKYCNSVRTDVEMKAEEKLRALKEYQVKMSLVQHIVECKDIAKLVEYLHDTETKKYL